MAVLSATRGWIISFQFNNYPDTGLFTCNKYQKHYSLLVLVAVPLVFWALTNPIISAN